MTLPFSRKVWAWLWVLLLTYVLLAYKRFFQSTILTNFWSKDHSIFGVYVNNTLAFKIWIDMLCAVGARILEFHISIQILNAKVYMFQIPPLDRNLCNYFHDFLKKICFFVEFWDLFWSDFDAFFNRKWLLLMFHSECG